MEVIYENNSWTIKKTPTKKTTIRKSYRYKKWRNSVLIRDNFTCQRCNNH